MTGYFLLCLISSIVFRAIRDTLPDNPPAQERIMGACLLALGIADVSSLSFDAITSLKCCLLLVNPVCGLLE